MKEKVCYYKTKAFYISTSLSRLQRALALSYYISIIVHIKGKKSQCFYSNQKAEWFLSTGYASVKGPSAQDFKKRSYYGTDEEQWGGGKTCCQSKLRIHGFCNAFWDRERLLKLFNTLENAIYMGMKKDLSFLIDGRLSLYEHQSTVNPNMPLRLLFYISDLYSGMTVEENLYSSKALSISSPCFVAFYNGAEPQPDMKVPWLSDFYMVKSEEGRMELTAVLLNINRSHNSELMEACRYLKGYAEYLERVRKYARELPLAEAVERAITECIREGRNA